MNRIDRLVALIVLLQSKKLIRGKEIAQYFNVSLRTVYRDINSICEAGVPVAAEAGEGYSIMPGYHLPPVMFTNEEAAALFTGAKFAEYFTDQSVKKHSLSAITKIRSVLPENTKEYMEKLQASVYFNSRSEGQGHFRDDVLTVIQEAVINNLVLRIEYYAAWSDSWSRREVEPWGIAYYNNHWHLIAWCRLRNDIRDFRADRLKKVYKTDERFTIRENSGVNEYINNLKQNGELKKVCIKVPRFISFSLREKLIVDFDEKEESGGKVSITFMSPGFNWLVPLLLSYATFIEIIHPPELKKILAGQALKIYKHHSK